ncbi:hypothetical protein X011_03420 [Mycobacterium tuberculosis variant microti OV254]|nr:hypothetical protein X011_03420 [Mycobacterium tuberculosis variant microti OV254]
MRFIAGLAVQLPAAADLERVQHRLAAIIELARRSA